MAVYHLKVSVGSRAGGQSARAKADYIEREGRYEKDREELEHKEHDHMPEWAEEDPRSYWAAADEHERANGSLFREITFALPKELSEGQRRELASGFAAGVTEGERLPYTLAVHRGGPDGENPHAHLMISERANDGIERSREQWFRRYNRQAPEKGGAKKSRTMMSREWVKDTREAWEREANEALRRAGCGERIDHRSLAERRDEAERSGDLERAAELSRKPNVHLGAQAYRAGELERRDEAERSGVLALADRVEKDNQAQAEERDGLIERIKEKIAGIYQELQALPEKIRGAGERIKAWEKEREREWVHRGGFEKARDKQVAEMARKYSHTRGPQISTTRSPQPTRGHEPDRGPSR